MGVLKYKNLPYQLIAFTLSPLMGSVFGKTDQKCWKKGASCVLLSGIGFGVLGYLGGNLVAALISTAVLVTAQLATRFAVDYFYSLAMGTVSHTPPERNVGGHRHEATVRLCSSGAPPSPPIHESEGVLISDPQKRGLSHAASHEGLKEIGAFAFYDNKGGLSKIYSMAANSGEETVPITFQKEDSSKGHSNTIDQEIKTLTKTMEPSYNLSWITYGPFLEYAKYFAFIDGKFVYKPHSGSSITLASVPEGAG